MGRGISSGPDREYPTQEDRMRLVIELSRSNVDQGTGGLFGAGIFDLSTNRLVAPDVNLVATTKLSAAHAEMVAIMILQQVVGHFDLGGEGLRTSWSPARSRGDVLRRDPIVGRPAGRVRGA